MKKNLFSLILFLGLMVGLDAKAQDGFFQAEITPATLSIAPGEVKTISYSIQNEVPFCAFTASVLLPSGLEFVQNANGYNVSTSSRMVGTLKYKEKVVSDRKVNVIISSFFNDCFAGHEGEIISFQVRRTGDPIIGRIKVRNADCSDTDDIAHLLPDLTVQIEGATDYTLGDVDNNKVVNIADITALISHLNGKTPANFILDAADVDDNGVVDIKDIAGIVSIICK